ncbi:hypothetical protein BDF22DRAFT_306829 [Syncephalis plumigaleata]|nr:hypothetical protein BDF22DRAFT_306829 [Syncephalis plumigaleata]
MPEKDRKLIVNIKKRRQRAKRRRDAEADNDNNEDNSTEQTETRASSHPSKMNAYEDALYGSESDLDDSDDEVEGDRPMRTTATNTKTKKTQGGKSWIKEDEDTPLDFLGNQVVSHVTSSAPSKRQQRLGQGKLARLAHQFSTSADGRIMIEDGADKEDTAVLPGAIRGHDDDDDDDDDDDGNNNGMQGENYYLESKQSRETYTRVGQRIKFNNRGTHAETFDNDSDVEDHGTTAATGRSKVNKAGSRRTTTTHDGNISAKPMIGQAYRSKKASGDVKRAGRPDPYAYIPLNPLALKKRGPRAKLSVSITGKKKSGKIHKR